MEEEFWKDVVGFEGLYQVSNLGRVKSLFRYKVILKPYIDVWGYLVVNLYKNKKIFHIKIHRVVASAFIPNPDNKRCVDHIDTDKTNNKVSNLRWCTQKENCNNPTTLRHLSESLRGPKNHWFGRHHTEEYRKKRSEATKGDKAFWYGKKRSVETTRKQSATMLAKYENGYGNPKSKAVVQKDLKGSVVNIWKSIAEASRATNTASSGISRCCNGLKRQYKDFIWEFQN